MLTERACNVGSAGSGQDEVVQDSKAPLLHGHLPAKPTTAGEAAAMMLQGVRDERWRVLLGDDAQVLDRLVRENPEEAYEESFMVKLREQANWGL